MQESQPPESQSPEAPPPDPVAEESQSPLGASGESMGETAGASPRPIASCWLTIGRVGRPHHIRPAECRFIIRGLARGSITGHPGLGQSSLCPPEG